MFLAGVGCIDALLVGYFGRTRGWEEEMREEEGGRRDRGRKERGEGGGRRDGRGSREGGKCGNLSVVCILDVDLIIYLVQLAALH